MAAAELERLRMAGAGMAIAVLTSGGDAQGLRGAGGGGRQHQASQLAQRLQHHPCPG
uniref:Phosphofructokinase n=1 Tax=Calidris pygmaea TaxID=425635 RepID=A0A8C3JV78_9CHAR